VLCSRKNSGFSEDICEPAETGERPVCQIDTETREEATPFEDEARKAAGGIIEESVCGRRKTSYSEAVNIYFSSPLLS